MRISFAVRKNQEIEVLLTHMLERFLSLRADKLQILRKVAIEGYDFSFLITDEHLMRFKKEELINFILEFIQGIDKEINDMKLAIMTQTRLAATFFTNAVSNNDIGVYFPPPCFNPLPPLARSFPLTYHYTRRYGILENSY